MIVTTESLAKENYRLQMEIESLRGKLARAETFIAAIRQRHGGENVMRGCAECEAVAAYEATK